MNPEAINVIGEDEKFYGYIIGLQLERSPGNDVGTKFYVTFEYGGSVSVWQVPDPELFKILCGHLSAMAFERFHGDDYGYEKLWIKKDKGLWHAEVP